MTPVFSSFTGQNLVAVWAHIPPLQNSKANSLSGGVKYKGVRKFYDSRQKSPFISKTIRHKSMIRPYYGSLMGSHRQPVNPSWFQ